MPQRYSPSWLLVLAAALAMTCCLSLASAQQADEALVRMARIEDPRTAGIGRVVPDLELTAIRGEKHTLSSLLKDRKALVLSMTGATCPMSKDYGARIAELERAYAPRGVVFVHINALEAETVVEMQDQIKRYRLEGPYIPDRDGAARKALGVHTTTETYVIDPSRTLVYRGAVDDQHGIGKSLPAPNNNYLSDALDALLTGARPRVRATWAPGCLVSAGDGFASMSVAGNATYANRISWIFAESCVSCHRPGGAAPFALDTYESVNGRAKMIEAVVGDGLMPPWHGATHAADEPSPWVQDRSLSKEDREALLLWLRSDRPRGSETTSPVLSPLSRTWAIGEPDLLITSSGLRLPAKGGLQHARVMVGFPITEDKWLSAVELRPVESGSAHHALVWLLAPGDALPLPGEMPAKLELLGTYSPGDNVIRYQAGAARRIKAGSIFLVDLYAKPMGKEVISAMRIALKWGAEPTWSVRSVTAGANELRPGKEAGQMRAAVDLALPAGARVLSITPYMRSHGRAYTVESGSVGGGGGRERVIDAAHHDFRWVIRYEFLEPRLFSGQLLTLAGEFQPDAAGIPGFGSGAADESLLISAELLEPIVSIQK